MSSPQKKSTAATGTLDKKRQFFKLFLCTIVGLLKNQVEVIFNGFNINTLAYSDDLTSYQKPSPVYRPKSPNLKSASNSFSIRINPKKTKFERSTKVPNTSLFMS